MIVHGLDLSYFTGKLEAYLRLKGMSYRLEQVDTAGFIALGQRAGVRQMPHLALADGRLLTDTVTITDTLEAESLDADSGPSLTPADPAAAFIAHLIEAFADEHLWRSALYYRWAFDDDARQASRRLAEIMLRDVPVPLGLKRRYILARQRRLYVRGEGSGRRQAPVIEADYLGLLDALEPVFRTRDWLLGDAPTRADVGLFGPLFRHFLCDPTPGRIMRERAPATVAWTARVWAAGVWSSDRRPPPCARDLRLEADALADLAPLFRIVTDHFLPEAAANARACAQGVAKVEWARDGATFRYRVNPYRAWRLARLAGQYATLAPDQHDRLVRILGPEAEAILSSHWSAASPPTATEPTAVRDRWWHPV